MTLLFFSVALLLFVLRRYYLRLPMARFSIKVPSQVYHHYETIISKHIGYFNQLSEDGKRKFISRAIEIRRSLIFQGREGFVITPEVEILLSACMAQLTFGFAKPVIGKMDGIAVFPEVFYSRLAGNWVKGLAMNNGVVFISWADFLKGYEHSTDTYNLGLHELTHMLKLQAEDIMTADPRMVTYFEEWTSRAELVFSQLRTGKEDFFREYASTNMSEFFSVCIENFFEVPAEMERELPDLYYHLCYLMRQNPLNHQHDYRFELAEVEDVIRAKKIALPLHRFEHPTHEFKFWWTFRSFASILLYIDLLVFLFHGGQSRYFVLEGAVLVVCTYLLIRLLYYKSIQVALNHLYIRHLFLELLPLYVLMLYLINAAV